MEVFADFLKGIDDSKSRARTEEVLDWVGKTFPNLVPKIAWNQPMFTDHGTFIIGFSVAKKHLAVAPEGAAVDHFAMISARNSSVSPGTGPSIIPFLRG